MATPMTVNHRNSMSTSIQVQLSRSTPNEAAPNLANDNKFMISTNVRNAGCNGSVTERNSVLPCIRVQLSRSLLNQIEIFKKILRP